LLHLDVEGFEAVRHILFPRWRGKGGGSRMRGYPNAYFFRFIPTPLQTNLVE
jgi:hypothetical protein